jgi:hypothetical protein
VSICSTLTVALEWLAIVDRISEFLGLKSPLSLRESRWQREELAFQNLGRNGRQETSSRWLAHRVLPIGSQIYILEDISLFNHRCKNLE